VFVRKGNDVVSFAICHSVSLVEGRATEEMRVLKMVARSEADFDHLVTQLCAHARAKGERRVAIRVQGQYANVYRQADDPRGARAVDGSQNVGARARRAASGGWRDRVVELGDLRL